MGSQDGATAEQLLGWGALRLRECAIRDPILDAELLLAARLGLDRAQLLARSRDAVPPVAADAFRADIAERANGRPVAYIVGEREFYGLSFRVGPEVLIPRPETELLVEMAIEWLANRRALQRPRVADLGTGSGCIIIALAHQAAARGLDAEFLATDLSQGALGVANANAAALLPPGSVEFLLGDLLAPVAGALDLIISNPPYVARDDERLDPEVERFEPALALRDVVDGDGLGFFRRLAREAPARLAAGGALLVEVGDGQAAEVARIFGAAGFAAHVRRDLAGIERALLLE